MVCKTKIAYSVRFYEIIIHFMKNIGGIRKALIRVGTNLKKIKLCQKTED